MLGNSILSAQFMWLNTAILTFSVCVSPSTSRQCIRQDDKAKSQLVDRISFIFYSSVLPFLSWNRATAPTAATTPITIYSHLKQSGCSYPEKYMHFNTFPPSSVRELVLFQVSVRVLSYSPFSVQRSLVAAIFSYLQKNSFYVPTMKIALE